MTTLFEPSSALKPESATDLGTRYVEELAGQLRCFDRVILHGTLIDLAHPGALLVSMQQAGFRPRDLARFAQPITGQVREPIIGLARSERGDRNGRAEELSAGRSGGGDFEDPRPPSGPDPYLCG